MNLTINILQTDFNTTSALSIDTNGIVVNGDPVNTGGSSSSEMVVVDDGCPVDIEITQGTFSTYKTTITNVYKENKTIDIIMVPIVTDINDPNYLRPWPSVFFFNDPCNFCVDYYFASSYGGDVCWYVNNEFFVKGASGKACFCNEGDYQVKVRNITTQSVVQVPGCPPVVTTLWDNQFATTIEGNTVKGVFDKTLEEYLADDTITNVTQSEYRVDISYEVITDIEPLVTGDTCCYSKDEEVTIVPTVTYTREDAEPSLHNITYTVTDPEGLTLQLLQETFPLNIAEPYIAFTLTKLGVYTVKMEVYDEECGLSYDKEFIIETCNFVYLKYLECNAFEVQNRSSDTSFTWELSDIASVGTTIQSGTLAPGQAETLSFEDVSMFVLDVKYVRNEVTIEESYLMNNYCAIEVCFTEYIEDLLCEPDPRCSPCPPESDLKQMFLFYNAYFMKVNKLFQTNSFFTALDEEDLTYVVNIKQVMDKIVEFCKRRSCTDSTTSAFNSSYQTQGPYDYVGRGNTLDKGCATCK